MTIEYFTLHADGIRTAYLDIGSRKLPPIVLLHDGAFGSDALSCWGELIPLLSRRYRVIAPDFLGYGGSSKIFDFDLDPRTQRVNGVLSLCRALEITAAPFIGSSFGGSVALIGAASGRLPITVGVSIGGTAGPHMNQELFAEMHDYVPSAEAVVKLSRLVSQKQTDEAIARRLAASSSVSHRKSLNAARMRVVGEPSTPARASKRPITEQLAEIQTPFLFIAGSGDPLLAAGWEHEMASLLVNGEAQLIEGAGHLCQVDEPQIVADAIIRFVDAHQPTHS